MTQISRPWQSTTPGDAGPYSASDWWEIWKYIGPNDANTGPLIGSGVAPDIGLTVNAQGVPAAAVDITAGAASVQGTFYKNDATVTLSVAANGSGNARIDTIILRKDIAAQTVRLAILQGTPAASPVPPTLTQNLVTYEIPLADIAVSNGFVSIVQGNITPRRYFANAADGVYLLDVKNNSGVSLQTGDVVIWDTSADRSVTTTTIAGHNLTAGVWVGYTANAGYGRVLTRGIGYVNVGAAVASRGLQLATSTTVKIAVSGAIGTYQTEIGISLQTTSGSGLCLAYINVRSGTGPTARVFVDNGANYTTTSATFVDVSATNLSIDLQCMANASVLVGFTCVVQHSVASNLIAFDLTVNGTRIGTVIGAADGLLQVRPQQAAGVGNIAATFSLMIDSTIAALINGTNTIRLQWRTQAATATMLGGAGTANSDNIPQLWAKVIG